MAGFREGRRFKKPYTSSLKHFDIEKRKGLAAVLWKPVSELGLISTMQNESIIGVRDSFHGESSNGASLGTRKCL